MDGSGKLWVLTPWAKFPSPNLVDRSSPLQIPTPWAKFPGSNLVDRSSALWVRFSIDVS